MNFAQWLLEDHRNVQLDKNYIEELRNDIDRFIKFGMRLTTPAQYEHLRISMRRYFEDAWASIFYKYTDENLIEKAIWEIARNFHGNAIGNNEHIRKKVLEDRKYWEERIRKAAYEVDAKINDLPYYTGYSGESKEGITYREQAKFEEFIKTRANWRRRVQAKAKPLWDNLDQLIFWVERSYNKEDERTNRLKLVMPKDYVTNLEGFNCIIRGFGMHKDDKEKLEQLKEILRHYRELANERFPRLLKQTIPMRFIFGTGGGHEDIPMFHGGEYKQGGGKGANRIDPRAEINMMWGIKNPSETIHTIAHEQAHHMYYLMGKDKQKLWDDMIHNDYIEIDLKELLDNWTRFYQQQPTQNDYIGNYMDSIKHTDPFQYIRLDVLRQAHRERNGIGISFRSDVKQLLEKGKTTVRVPKHPISGYADKNPNESLAEAISNYVTYGPRSLHPVIRKMLTIFFNQ